MTTFFPAQFPNFAEINWHTCATACINFAATPLFQRVVENWQESLMLAGVVVAVVGAVTAFFYGFTFLSCSFLFLGGLSALGAFFMRQISILKGFERERRHLEIQNRMLRTRINEFAQTTRQLRHQTHRLHENNVFLNHQNKTLGQHCDQLGNTNRDLHSQLEQLTTHNAQLRASSETICREVSSFSKSNQSLEGYSKGIQTHAETLQRQLHSSKVLFDDIADKFNTHEKGLGEKISRLSEHFQELWGEKSVLARLQTLEKVRDQIAQETEKQKAISSQTQQLLQEHAALKSQALEMQQTALRVKQDLESILSEYRTAASDQNIQTSKLQDIATKMDNFQRKHLPSPTYAS